MPFGLRNALGTFQRTLDVILSSIKWQFALVYLDYIVVFNRALQQHIDHECEDLALLHSADATIELRKCKFFTHTINYLGHVITQGAWNLLLAQRTTSVYSSHRPTSRSYNSYLAYASSSDGSCLALLESRLHFNPRLKNGQSAFFTPLYSDELLAMETLKNALIIQPIQAVSYSGGYVTLETDACNVQIGCSLLQDQPNGTTKPIGCWSRSLIDSEK